MKKTLALLMAIMMLLGLLAGCNTTPDPTDAPTEAPKPTDAPKDDPTEAPEDPTEAPAAEPNYLRLSMSGFNDTKSGFKANFAAFNHPFKMLMLYETLLGYIPETNTYVNILAESVDMSPDGLTYTVKLKDGPTFHDGEPVTSEDVAFTFAAMVGCAGSASGQLANLKGYQEVLDGEADRISGIVCKDEKTVVFEFAMPNFLFMETLASFGFSILPAHCFEGLDWLQVQNSGYWVKPIGSGPYKINEVSWPDYVTLTARDDWHMGTPGIKDILLTIYNDTTAADADYMAGKLHIGSGLSESRSDTIRNANPALKSAVIDSGYCRFFVFNMSDEGRPEMRDARVRKAISLIVDKQMIVDYVGAQASVATNQSALFYNTDIPVWKRDVEEGKRLLQEAGYDFSTPLRLYTNYKDQQSVDIMDIVVANLAEAGVTAEYVFGGDNAVAKIYEIRDYDVYYGGGMGIKIANYNTWSSGQLYDAWYNPADADYRYARYQALFNQYKATPDEEGRMEIYDQIQLNAMEDMYMCALWFRNTMWVVDEKIGGFEPWATDYDTCVYRDVCSWSLAD